MKTSVNYNLDQMIAKAMREAANVVFAAMPISKDVNLTALQVYEHFTKAKANVKGMPKDNNWYSNISVCSGDGFTIGENAEIVINVDSYTCKVYGIEIFRFVHIFERLASVKDRARFIYSVPTSEAAVTLNISVDKSAKDIFAHVAKDDLRPVMNSVYVDFVHSNIVASDGHTIQVMRCNIEGAQPEINGVAIPSHIAKNAFAKRSFVMTIDGDHITCNNESFDVIGRYPNYLSVWRSFRSEDDELIQFAPNAWKEVTSKAKAMQKQYTKVMFVFHALSGEHVITVDVWNFYENIKVNEFKVNTAAAVPVSFGVGFFTDSLTRFKGVSRLQGLDNGRGVVMYGADYLGILMPGKMEDLPVNYPMYESENKGTFAPIAAYEIKRVINEPVVTVETINEPVERVETINEPVERVETINEPVVTVETINEPVVTVETINEPVESVETINEPVVTVETINEPVVTVETINEPVECVETINEPVESVETINEPVVTVETINEPVESRMSATAFITSFVAMMAACILSFIAFVVNPHAMPAEAVSMAANVAMCEPAAADPVAPVAISEAADVVTIEAEINDVICTGSFDLYYNKVKEEIITNYRAVMESQLYELADLASVDDSEVFVALADPETDTETPESVPTVESIEDTENTPESVEIMPTDTDTETDPGTVSDNTKIDYNSSEYVELSVITTDANGDPVVNVYSVPLNE